MRGCNALGHAVRLTAHGAEEKLSAFARRAGIPYGTMRGYASGKSQPGIEHLERLQEAGVDVAGVMSEKISFTAADPALSMDWPMLEGAHAGNALLGLMFVRAFQSVLFRRIADASDAWLAKHRGKVWGGGKELPYRKSIAVGIAHWVYATDRLRAIATATDVDVKKIASLTMDEIAYIALLGMPESDIRAAIAQVAENERERARKRLESVVL